MTSVELVKKICKVRKIPISKLERELGYSNGYIGQLRKGTIPSDRAAEIAEYLNISLNYLVSGGENVGNEEKSALTKSDKREIGRDLDRIMDEIENDVDGPLYYNGVPIDDHSLELLRKALELGLTDLKKENKVKYNPNKNKGKK